MYGLITDVTVVNGTSLCANIFLVERKLTLTNPILLTTAHQQSL